MAMKYCLEKGLLAKLQAEKVFKKLNNKKIKDEYNIIYTICNYLKILNSLNHLF